MSSIPDSLLPERIQVSVSKLDGQRAALAEEESLPQFNDNSSGRDGTDSSDHGTNHRLAKRQRTGFSCQVCHMPFTEKRALARHRRTDHHRKQLGLPPDRKHVCHSCGKYFTRGHDLKRHQNEQHPDVKTTVPGLSLQSSSLGSEDSSEQPSDNGSSIRSVSQASNATVNTSLRSTAEPVSTTTNALPQSSDSKFASFTSTLHEESRWPRRHFKSEPNIRSSTAEKQNIRKQSRLSIVEDEDESLEDIDTNICAVSDCSRDALSDALAQPPTPPRRLRQTIVANAERLAQLPTKPLDIDFWHTKMCVMCGDAFEDNSGELLKHLRRHLDDFKGSYRCQECRIDFVHEKDLQQHLQCAAKGHCGFRFPHTCTGHHPPSLGSGFDDFSDYDRARLCVRLQNWEQAQLQAYIAEIEDLTTTRSTRTFTRWSDIFRGSAHRDSFSSFAISVNTHATAPCDVSRGKTDVGGLQKRLQQMSLGNVSSKVRDFIHPRSTNIQAKTADGSLHEAIKNEDVSEVQKLLDMGAEPSIIHDHKGPFVAMALWGRSSTSGPLAEHRLDEDLVGSCSVCNLSTGKFEKGYHKVDALLRHQTDPNQPGGLCGYPLATAAWMGRADIVRLLLQASADIQQKRGRWGTALCAAAAQTGFSGQRDVVRLLIRKGADVHVRGPEGTALELAKKRRGFWVARKMSLGSNEEEMRGRISCCDEVISMLEQEERKPFKRCVTPALGGIMEHEQ